jgi:hypothetical protein
MMVIHKPLCLAEILLGISSYSPTPATESPTGRVGAPVLALNDPQTW